MKKIPTDELLNIVLFCNELITLGNSHCITPLNELRDLINELIELREKNEINNEKYYNKKRKKEKWN